MTKSTISYSHHGPPPDFEGLHILNDEVRRPRLRRKDVAAILRELPVGRPKTVGTHVTFPGSLRLGHLSSSDFPNINELIDQFAKDEGSHPDRLVIVRDYGQQVAQRENHSYRQPDGSLTLTVTKQTAVARLEGEKARAAWEKIRPIIAESHGQMLRAVDLRAPLELEKKRERLRRDLVAAAIGGVGPAIGWLVTALGSG